MRVACVVAIFALAVCAVSPMLATGRGAYDDRHGSPLPLQFIVGTSAKREVGTINGH
jgi:hypothetical protein